LGSVGGDNGCGSLVEEGELSCAEPGRSVMVGVEWESEASRLFKALWLLELPLSLLRWATIPTDGEWDWRRRRWAMATPPLASILLCIEVSGGVGDALSPSAGAMPLVLLLPLACSPLPFALWRFTRDDVAPCWYAVLVVAGFAMSIVWLNLIATEVVALIETAGFLLGISTSILGLTVIAIGNSAGDLVSDIAAAKGGEAKMAVAACFGSPLLMNIIGAGASLTMRAISTGGANTESSVSQVCRIAYLFLYAALFSHMLVFPANGYTATRRYAVYLFCLYGVFMLLALLAEGGLLGDFMCPQSAPCLEKLVGKGGS
jgi:sodium/potassium/calcium exchanger 6